MILWRLLFQIKQRNIYSVWQMIFCFLEIFKSFFKRFLESAGTVLNYFESFLGRIEIKTADKVAFGIKNIIICRIVYWHFNNYFSWSLVGLSLFLGSPAPLFLNHLKFWLSLRKSLCKVIQKNWNAEKTVAKESLHTFLTSCEQNIKLILRSFS